MKKIVLSVLSFLFLPFVCFSLSEEYSFSFPKGYYGTYVPVVFEEVLDTSGSYLKALYTHDDKDQSPHTLLMITDSECYSDAHFHDGYAITAEILEKYSFDEDSKHNKIVVDDRGIKYKLISKKSRFDGGYDAYASFVMNKIFRNQRKFPNIRVENGFVLINSVWYKLELDPNEFAWDEYVSCFLTGDTGTFALEMDGIDGELYRTANTGFMFPTFCTTSDRFTLIRGLFNYVSSPVKKPEVFVEKTNRTTLYNGIIFKGPAQFSLPAKNEYREIEYYYMTDVQLSSKLGFPSVYNNSYFSRKVGSCENESKLHVTAVKETASFFGEKILYKYWFKIEQENVCGWIYGGRADKPLIDFTNVLYEKFSDKVVPELKSSDRLLFKKNGKIYEAPSFDSAVLGNILNEDESILYSAVTLSTDCQEDGKSEHWVKIDYNGITGWVFGADTDSGRGGAKYKDLPNIHECLYSENAVYLQYNLKG